MNSLFDENAQPAGEKPDADLTLGIGSLLSIFFGVVLICGIFFGFGYSMGRRATHGASAVATTAAQSTPAETAPETASKRPDSDAADSTAANNTGADSTGAINTGADRSGAKQDKSATAAATDPPDGPAAAPAKKESGKDAARRASDTEPPAKAARVIEPETTTASLTEAPAPRRTTAKPHAGVMNPPPAPVVDAQPTPGHPVMVQIAAVSREEDAETLAGALRKRGFSPQVRGGTSDKFFHVQVGPFTDKTAAETMKQHLLADGYNAIVK